MTIYIVLAALVSIYVVLVALSALVSIYVALSALISIYVVLAFFFFLGRRQINELERPPHRERARCSRDRWVLHARVSHGAVPSEKDWFFVGATPLLLFKGTLCAPL